MGIEPALGISSLSLNAFKREKGEGITKHLNGYILLKS